MMIKILSKNQSKINSKKILNKNQTNLKPKKLKLPKKKKQINNKPLVKLVLLVVKLGMID